MPTSAVNAALQKIRDPSYTSGSPAGMDSQGLQMPPEVMALISSLLMPPVMQGAGNFAGQLPGQIARTSEAGAIFPEGLGASLPKDKSLIRELGDILPESQKNYIRNQQLSDWHASNMDFPAVLRDKWALLKNFGGN